MQELFVTIPRAAEAAIHWYIALPWLTQSLLIATLVVLAIVVERREQRKHKDVLDQVNAAYDRAPWQIPITTEDGHLVSSVPCLVDGEVVDLRRNFVILEAFCVRLLFLRELWIRNALPLDVYPLVRAVLFHRARPARTGRMALQFTPDD